MFVFDCHEKETFITLLIIAIFIQRRKGQYLNFGEKKLGIFSFFQSLSFEMQTQIFFVPPKKKSTSFPSLKRNPLNKNL